MRKKGYLYLSLKAGTGTITPGPPADHYVNMFLVVRPINLSEGVDASLQ